MAQRSCRITVNGSNINCSPDPIPVKKDVDTIQWTCQQSFTLNVPGMTVSYSQTGGNFLGSTGPFSATGTVKYDVTVGGNTLDPDIEVQP